MWFPLKAEYREQPVLSTNITGTMCYDNLVCEEECCHDLEFGLPYCCSKYTGFIYLGLMVGGGIIIAVLVIACYVCMKRTERELEAAAKLEAAKAANNVRNGSVTETSSSTEETDLENQQDQSSNFELPPPAYQEVMRNFTRCHSCDVTRTIQAQSVDIVNSLVRQYSQGSHAPLSGLPVLVDVQELIARHRREHSGHGNIQQTGLPPVMTEEPLENKLPTYEECTSTHTELSFRSRECPSDNQTCRTDKPVSHILTQLDINMQARSATDGDQKRVGESNAYFEDMSITIRNPERESRWPFRTAITEANNFMTSETETRNVMIANTETRDSRITRTDTLGCRRTDTESRGFGIRGAETRVSGIIDTDARNLITVSTEKSDILKADTETRHFETTGTEKRDFGTTDFHTRNLTIAERHIRSFSKKNGNEIADPDTILFRLTDSETRDLKVTDTETRDFEITDTKTRDLKATDTEIRALNVTDTETRDFKVTDTETRDFKVTDTETRDFKVTDTKTRDLKATDTEIRALNVTDTETRDFKVTDTETRDFKVTDTETRDFKVTDTETRDFKVTDAETRDFKVTDTETRDLKATDTETRDNCRNDSEATYIESQYFGSKHNKQTSYNEMGVFNYKNDKETSETSDIMTAGTETRYAMKADTEVRDIIAADTEKSVVLTVDAESVYITAAETTTRDITPPDTDICYIVTVDTEIRCGMTSDIETDITASETEIRCGMTSGTEIRNIRISDTETRDSNSSNELSQVDIDDHQHCVHPAWTTYASSIAQVGVHIDVNTDDRTPRDSAVRDPADVTLRENDF